MNKILNQDTIFVEIYEPAFAQEYKLSFVLHNLSFYNFYFINLKI